MSRGRYSLTAGPRRDVVAVDAATGETSGFCTDGRGNVRPRRPANKTAGLGTADGKKGHRKFSDCAPGYQLGRSTKTGPRASQPCQKWHRRIKRGNSIGKSCPPPRPDRFQVAGDCDRDVVWVVGAAHCWTAPRRIETNMTGVFADSTSSRKSLTFKTIRVGKIATKIWEKDSCQVNFNAASVGPPCISS